MDCALIDFRVGSGISRPWPCHLPHSQNVTFCKSSNQQSTACLKVQSHLGVCLRPFLGLIFVGKPQANPIFQGNPIFWRKNHRADPPSVFRHPIFCANSPGFAHARFVARTPEALRRGQAAICRSKDSSCEHGNFRRGISQRQGRSCALPPPPKKNKNNRHQEVGCVHIF